MKTITQLNQLIKSHNITQDIDLLPENLLGFYQHSSSGFYIILKDCPEMHNDDRLYKCVLAHEVGHYFTTIGINEPLKTNTYSKNMRILKEENKADKWAVDYLIDTELLIDYLSTHTLARLEDLIDHFQVTEDFMLKKLKFMSDEKNYWHVRDKQYLCLSNLPSMYIATFFDSSHIEYLD